MAATGAEAGAPNLNLTNDEKKYYGQLFRQADTDGVGVVTGEIAVKFFDKTRLESSTLGEIWQIADKENRGFLTPAGFGIVLRLIGHAQAGREPTPELALQPGPLPRFDGITIPGLVPQTSGSGQGPAPGPLQAQGTGVRIPPLSPEKAAQFAGLFEQQNLAPGNILPGDQARQIFERSGLPTELLGRIWQLADTEQRGALVQTEFIIAMHLLASMKQGQLRGLPSVVPAGLYEAATRRPTALPRSPTSATPPVPAIPRQLSGQAQMRTGSPLGRSQVPPASGGDWLVSSADKARFDQEYAKLDTAKKGFITGEEAVPFFSQSELPEDTLAQIWDLADITSAGRLTRDEFAIAMYLIRQQRINRNSPLPATLPQNLIPPSMRGQVRPPTANAAASAFDAPAPVQPPPPPAQPKSALDDLFGLDSSSPPPAAPVQKPITTGGSNDPFGSNASPASASPAKPSPTVPSFAPFVPSSSFGRTLTAQATGASNSSSSFRPSPQVQPQQASSGFDDDLLGDHDESSKNISNDSAELANLSNQVSSLSKHMQEVQGQRTTTQNELNQSNAQKKNFEQRLSQLRALYEKEAKDVRALEDQLSASRTDAKKLQTEMAMLEGTYQDLQNQHQQVLAALQADQQENANLKERIRAVNAEVAQLKPQIEKLKLEARQQKGLVAINKKQLATNEAERERLKAEAEELTKGQEELARQNTAGSAGPVVSPAASTASINNPFFRRTGSTDIMGAFASPPAKPSTTDKSFDDVFGPSFGAAASTPPPPTGFLPRQNTGASTGSAGSFATPATSNTPNLSRQLTSSKAVAGPPPPPESRQMGSSFMPFGEAGSVSSSRPVSPHAGRMGQVDATISETGPMPFASMLEPNATGQSAASGSQKFGDMRPTSSASSAGGAHVFGGGPAPAPQDDLATPPASHQSRAPGHFPSDSTSDPFSTVDQAKAKDDFDSAFASFKNAHAKPASGADFPSSSTKTGGDPVAAFASEFPPISELERDDYSESDSDKDGFEDDFAPSSPKPAGEAAKAKATEASKPDAASTTPAGADGATSAIAASPPAAESSSSVNTPMPAQNKADPFGASSPAAPAASGTPSADAPKLPEKKSFDDLDDDFEGLEDAQEGSAADEDFANISRSVLDDFNPVFDDSSPPRSHAAKSDGSTANAATSSSGAPNLGAETSSFDLVSGSSASLGSTSGAAASSATAAPPTSGPAAAAGAADNQDWDALFADLDSTGTKATSPTASASAAAPARPSTVGRALTEEGEHDDPILKNLTSMGYSRNDAVNALEKYDYNLERAANYLASQS